MHIRCLFVFLFCFIFRGAMAQQPGTAPTNHTTSAHTTGDEEEGDDYDDDGKSYFSGGVNYLSDNVYLGRKDSFPIPYYSPYVSYHNKYGFFVKGMVSYTPTSKKDGNAGHVDLTTISTGYNHDITEHLYGGGEFDKYFFYKNSLNVRASVPASAFVYLKYVNNIVQPMLLGMGDFGTTTDYITAVSIDHNFTFFDGKMEVAPTIQMFAGTTNFFDAYLVNRTVTNAKGKKKTKTKTKLVNSASAFQVQDYEFSVDATFATKHLLFKVVPMYILPLNPSTITNDGITTQQKLTNSFVLEVDVAYRYFTVKKNN